MHVKGAACLELEAEEQFPDTLDVDGWKAIRVFEEGLQDGRNAVVDVPRKPCLAVKPFTSPCPSLASDSKIVSCHNRLSGRHTPTLVHNPIAARLVGRTAKVATKSFSALACLRIQREA